MTNKYHNKKENEEVKVDEIILQVEEAANKEKKQFAEDTVSSESSEPVKKIGDKISLVLVFALLLLSIIQSIELFNLRGQILKGQFTGAAPASAAGSSQGLPAQQGGC